jgi:hypothetical protein
LHQKRYGHKSSSWYNITTNRIATALLLTARGVADSYKEEIDVSKHTPKFTQPQFEFPQDGPNPSGLCMCGCGQPTTIAKRSHKGNGWIKGQPICFIRGHNDSPPRIIDPITRFWKYVKRDAPDKCWLWQGAKHNFGYGVIHDGTRMIGTHRFSWQIHIGPIPDGLFVLHRCDVPGCVNPNHLFLGTNSDNMHDKEKKGRGRYVSKPGEQNPIAKLTDEAVRQIRHDVSLGSTQKKLADQYHVTPTTISDIVKRKRWKHIP